MNIGQAIKNLRMAQGMTQMELSQKCDMSTNAVSMLERGERFPPKGTIQKLCQAFGVPQSYLALAAIEESDIPEEKRVLYRALVEPLRDELLDSRQEP